MSEQPHLLLDDTPPELVATCTWCGIHPSQGVYLFWPTCIECLSSRDVRVRAYQDRLGRTSKGK